MSQAYLKSKATSEVSKHVQLELLRAACSLSQWREARNIYAFIIACSSLDWMRNKTPLRSNCVSGFAHTQGRMYLYLLLGVNIYYLPITYMRLRCSDHILKINYSVIIACVLHIEF